jgi:hypothetical protein
LSAFRRISMFTKYSVLRLFVALFIILMISGAASASPQLAPNGTGFTYQGKLIDGGVPANGTYDLQFKLFDALSSGSQVGGIVPVLGVTVTNGLFTVQLDFGNVFNGTALYLEIGVRLGGSSGAYTTLAPRQPLSPTPYALYTTQSGNTGMLNNQPATYYLNASNINSGTLGINYFNAYAALVAEGYLNNAANNLALNNGTLQATLNADLLDGLHAASFALASHTHWGQTWTGSGTGLTLSGGTIGLSGSGSTYGVSGTSTNSNGVYGTSTNGNGVSGSSTSSAGVYGSGGGYGVAGSSTTGTGVYGSGGAYGVSGTSTNNPGIYGSSTNGYGVFGSSTNGYGVAGSSTSSYGVYGSGSSTGVYGYSPSGTGKGVYGYGNTGVYGSGSGTGSTGVYGSGDSYGVWGLSSTTSGMGVYGYSSGTNGTGVSGSGTATGVTGSSTNGNGVTGSSTNGYGVSGSSTNNTGVYGTGNAYGVYGIGQTTYSAGVYGSGGTGVDGVGSGTGSTGVYGSGNSFGVYGTAATSSGYGVYGNAYGGTGNYAGYFQGNVYINGSLIATGGKSAAVETQDYGTRLLYAVESPENWFQDFGTGQLMDGKAVIKIDPVFAETVNLADDYHVFITPMGDCALYVTDKTPTSFTVKALGGQTCSIAFDYNIVAKRLGYETVRLAVADPLPVAGTPNK